MSALGLLPLFFFAVMAWTHWRKGKTAECLWMCHVSNLLLSLGMLFDLPLLVRAAVPWLLLGIPLWVLDMAYLRYVIPASVFSHAGGTLVGLFALSRVGADPSMWWASFLFFLALQPVSRWMTPLSLNVNLSHRVHGLARPYFPSYGLFWVSITALTAAVLWGISRWMQRLF